MGRFDLSRYEATVGGLAASLIDISGTDVVVWGPEAMQRLGMDIESENHMFVVDDDKLGLAVRDMYSGSFGRSESLPNVPRIEYDDDTDPYFLLNVGGRRFERMYGAIVLEFCESEKYGKVFDSDKLVKKVLFIPASFAGIRIDKARYLPTENNMLYPTAETLRKLRSHAAGGKRSCHGSSCL